MKKTNKKQAGVKGKTLQALGEVLTNAPVVESAPVVEISAPAVVVNGVSVNPGSGDLIMGDPINSKRITPGARIDRYRVVPSQRKTDNAGYYVQGGYVWIKPGTTRELFTVAVEIPYAHGTEGLRSAQARCFELNADLKRELERTA